MRKAIKCLLIAYIGSAIFILLGAVVMMIVGYSLHNYAFYNNLGFKVLCQFVAHAMFWGPLNALLMIGVLYFKRHPLTFGAIQWAIVSSAIIPLVILKPTRLFVLFYMVYAFPALLISFFIKHQFGKSQK